MAISGEPLGYKAESWAHIGTKYIKSNSISINRDHF